MVQLSFIFYLLVKHPCLDRLKVVTAFTVSLILVYCFCITYDSFFFNCVLFFAELRWVWLETDWQIIPLYNSCLLVLDGFCSSWFALYASPTLNYHPSFIVKSELLALANPKKAKDFAWFFKTGKGEYGEGDVFYGVRVPDCRTIAKAHKDLPFSEVEILIKDEVNEVRQTAGLILVQKMNKATPQQQEDIFNFYLNNLTRMNNWNLVDLTCYFIVGPFIGTDKCPIDRLASSSNLWERRTAIVSTMYCIRRNEFTHTFRIAKKLLKDPHDLIHKAVGWMIREVGKRDKKDMMEFMRENVGEMANVTFRYACERLSAAEKNELVRIRDQKRSSKK